MMLAPLTPRTALALLSPSARVLVAAAMPDGGASVVEHLPWSDVHWPTLVSLTSFERAEAHVFRLLRAAPVGSVPDDVHHAMQGIFRVAAFRSAELSEAAGAAVDALAEAGVSALWLKGAALAMQSTDDFMLRSMGDLDLLVRPEQHVAAREALRLVGWRESGSESSYAGHHHDAPLLWRGGIRLELHRSLFPPRHPFADVPSATWVARGVEVVWGERRVRVLPVVWHLVHASVHWAWNHEGEVGSWQYLHDAHRLSSAARAAGVEWREVVAAARSIGAGLPVGWGLWTASRLADLAIDESAISELRGRNGWLTGMTEREWVLRAFHSPAASPSVAWSRYWWRQAMHGLGDAVSGWPWVLGRAGSVDAGLVDAGEVAGAAGALAGGDGGATRSFRRWRRHLGRVLGG